MEKLLMDSKLLSGGIQNRFLYTFKEDVKRDLNCILEITSDFTLHELLEV